MKALLIGGTGLISTAVTRLLSETPGWEVTLLNRGTRKAAVPENVVVLRGDISNEKEIDALLGDAVFDVVAEFTGFTPDQVERDVRLFRKRTRQYMYISSAAGYLTPPANHVITEGVPLCNPYWQYARDKIACEDVLLRELRANGFPVTIIRPSHTYGDIALPLSLEADTGCWPVLDRMLKGRPVIIPGDGSSLWTVTYNSDFAKGFVGLMGNPHAIGEAIHITTDESLTWLQIHQAVADALGVKPNFYFITTDFLVAAKPSLAGQMLGDKRHSVFYDNTKLKRLVPAFCATVRFDEGARRAVRHFLATPELQRADPTFDTFCDKLVDVTDRALAEMKAFLR